MAQIELKIGGNAYTVACRDGEEGHHLGDTEPYDAVILDLGLPVMDGVSVLEKWRRSGRKMPVLILTARDRWSDKVQGFDAGADDYVAKPFHLEEELGLENCIHGEKGCTSCTRASVRSPLAASAWTLAAPPGTMTASNMTEGMQAQV